MELAKMTSKGQLTIPAGIRKRLGIGTGDQVLFYEKDGQIVISGVTPSALAQAQISNAENHIYSIEEIKKIAVPIAKKYGVDALYLFGSYARNEATKDSDLDFVIEKGKVRTLLALGGLQDELSEAFRKRVDVVTEDSLTVEFKETIRKDRVLLYDGKQ